MGMNGISSVCTNSSLSISQYYLNSVISFVSLILKFKIDWLVWILYTWECCQYSLVQRPLETVLQLLYFDILLFDYNIISRLHIHVCMCHTNALPCGLNFKVRFSMLQIG